MADTTAERTVPLAVERVAFRAWLEGDDETWDSVLGTYRAVLADPEALLDALDAVPRRECDAMQRSRNTQRQRAERAEAERDRLAKALCPSHWEPSHIAGNCPVRRLMEAADGPPLPG